MKKLIAISVMLVLIVGAVFAETSVGGEVATRMSLVNVDGDGNLTTSADGLDGHHIQISGQNDEGTIGGLLRVGKDDDIKNYAYVWWQPIPQLKIFLGQNGDGMFGSDGLVSWSWYKQGTAYLSQHDWGLWRTYFPGNWDDFGLAFSIYPIDGLSINLAFPMGGMQTAWGQSLATQDTVDWLKQLQISVDYNIADIGTLYVRYKLPGTSDGAGQAHLSFNVTAIEGLAIQPGVTLKINDGTPDVLIGLGFWFTGDGFGINLRAGAQLKADNSLEINAGLLPYFSLSDSVSAYVQIEAIKVTDSGVFEMVIFPSLKAFFGPGWLGFGIKANFDADGNFGLAVPIQFTFDF